VIDSLLIICPNDPRIKETFVDTQARALTDIGWNVTVAYFASQPGEVASDQPANPITYLPIEVEPLRTPRSFPARACKVVRTWLSGNAVHASTSELERWRRLIDRLRPSRILVQFGPVAARLLPVLERCGVPWAVQFHGYDLTRECRHWGYRRTLATLARRAGALFVPSRFLENRLKALANHANHPKVFRVTPGYDEDLFRFSEPEKRDDAGRSLQVVAVGRLVAVKGHRNLLRAIATTGSETRLTIVGEGEERTKLEQLIGELGVASKVTLAGALPPGAVRKWLVRSDVFVLASTASADGAVEGLGLGPIEAAATGLPVIVSDSGGLKETCIDGETGLVIRDGDFGAFGKCLDELHGNPERRRRMGEAGAKWAAETFASRVQARAADRALRAMA
jgi:glycosyltransferase involved in cell wall biosynthesis